MGVNPVTALNLPIAAFAISIQDSVPVNLGLKGWTVLFAWMVTSISQLMDVQV